MRSINSVKKHSELQYLIRKLQYLWLNIYWNAPSFYRSTYYFGLANNLLGWTKLIWLGWRSKSQFWKVSVGLFQNYLDLEGPNQMIWLWPKSTLNQKNYICSISFLWSCINSQMTLFSTIVILSRDFLIYGRRSLIWDVRLGG